jgi:hypothetical protein
LQQQGSTPGWQDAMLAAQQARVQHTVGSGNEQAAPRGVHVAAAWQTPALWAVEPLPVPPTQLFEQHWEFFLHALPLALQSAATVTRPRGAASAPMATAPARPRRVWRRDRV